MNAPRISTLPPVAMKWLLACLGFALLPLFFHLSPWIPFFACLVAAWRYFLEIKGSPIPPAWMRILLLVVLMGGILLQEGTVLGRDAGTGMFVGLLALKILETIHERDSVVAASLGFILLLSSLLFSQSILMGLYLLVATLFILVVLMKIQTRFSPIIHSRSMLRPALILLVIAIPWVAFLFVFFPRIRTQLAFPIKASTSGLSEIMKPGDVSTLGLDLSIAFRATFPDNVKITDADLYWRGFILWDTNGREWSRGVPVSDPPSHLSSPTSRTIAQDIILMPHGQRWMFALDYPIETERNIRLRTGQLIEASSPVQGKLHYQVISDPAATPSEISEEIWKRGLRKPRDISPNVMELSETLRAQSPDPEVYIRNVLDYFKSGFSYTLSPGAYGQDPLAEFLLLHKKGFCEHFANAFAVLMRLGGVPCRIVTGYQGGEYNSYGNFWIVRQANAHAWCEVWLANRGWVRVDPTMAVAPGRLTGSLEAFYQSNPAALGLNEKDDPLGTGKNSWQPAWAQKILKKIRMQRDRVDYEWDQWLVSYDTEAQDILLSRLHLSRADALWLSTLAIGGLVILLYFLAGRLMPFKISHARGPEKLYQKFCQRLAQKGVTRNPTEGPLDFTRRAATVFTEEQIAIQEIGWLYARLHYGPPQPPDTLGQMHRRIQNLHLIKRNSTVKASKN